MDSRRYAPPSLLTPLIGKCVDDEGEQTTMRDSVPETDVEKVRKSAQKLYLEEQKYWKDNEELINKQIEEDKQRQMAE